MKKIVVLLALLIPGVLCIASCGSDGKKEPTSSIQPDSTVCAMLGRSTTDVLFNPSSVTCYTLMAKGVVDSADVEVEPYWVRDSLIGKLAPETYGILQFALIANGENYKDDTLRIKAPYIPVLEFEFQQKELAAHVLISLSDQTWTVMQDNQRQIHFNFRDPELMRRFCELFVKIDND